MKKKLLVLGLCAGLMLTACGTQDTADTDTPATENTAVSETAETEAVTEAVDTEAETEAAASEIQILKDGVPVSYEGKDLVMTMTQDDETLEGIVTLAYGDESVQVSDFAVFLPDSYLIPGEDGAFYVAAVTGDYDDWEYTRMISYVPGEGFTLGESIDGGIDDVSAFEGNIVTITSRVNCFGTYSCDSEYAMDGLTLVRQGSYYDLCNVPNEERAAEWKEADEDDSWKQMFSEDGRRILVAAKAFKAVSDDGSEVTVAAGDTIYPEGVDTEDHVFYFSYNDAQYHFTYDQTEEYGEITVDGVSQYDLFEVVPYAG